MLGPTPELSDVFALLTTHLLGQRKLVGLLERKKMASGSRIGVVVREGQRVDATLGERN